MTDTDLAAIEARLKHAARLAPAYATVGGGKDVALLAACYDAYRKAEARAIAAEAREARLREALIGYLATDGSCGMFDALLLAKARDRALALVTKDAVLAEEDRLIGLHYALAGPEAAMTEPRTQAGRDLPDRIVVGANGAYWRDYGTYYSMCPVSEDNDPVEVVAVYVREAEALPSVERLARAVPERLPTGNPDVDRLRAAWNEGRAAILAALRDDEP